MQVIEVRNPATGECVGVIDSADSEQIVRTVQAARYAQKTWARLPFEDRADLLARFHDRLIDRADAVMDTIQSETGKTRRDALGEVITVAGTARYYIKNGKRFLSTKRRHAAVPAITGASVEYRPHGVVGLITPWNYPLILGVADALPALLAGNAVVIKPSELTPLSTILGKEMLVASGLNPDLFGIVHGKGDVASQLIQHVDYVGFTGSTETGRKVAVAAASRLIPFSLELGGKNPMIVLRGASLDDAASALLAGAFSNCGQTCISIERVYVERAIFDEFARKVTDQTSRLKVGWSKSWDMDVGSLIHSGHADKVMSHIDGAIGGGAQVLAGGRRRTDLGPSFVEPTVLKQVSSSMALASQETFGPVVSLYPVDNIDEAIHLANDSEYGLNASVWAAGSTQAYGIAKQLEAGSVAINSTLLIYHTFDVPMGGIKHSGIGRRHGEQGILRYTQAQSIVRSFTRGGGYDMTLTKIGDAKTARMFLRAVKWLRRLPGYRG